MAAHLAAARSSAALVRAMREGAAGTQSLLRSSTTGMSAAGGAVQRQQAARRGFAAAAGEEARVNFWEAPTAISKWKEEHIVILVLSCWGVGIYGAMKMFGGGGAKKAAEAEAK